MTNLWDLTVSDWKDNYGVSKIKWKTTVGIGDSMYAFNSAYMRAFVNQKPVKLELHHHFPKDHYFHYEDPESVDFRADYVLDRYIWKDIVNVEYVFSSEDYALYQKKYLGVRKPWSNYSTPYKQWMFDPTLDTTSISKKIVLWRPTFNSDQQLRLSKMCLLDHEWARLIDRLKDFGYDVVEIGYRTPVSEAMYHIRTCECCLSYEGMWHYITKNFFKPHIVIGEASITKWHTPAAIQIKEKNFFIDTELKKITYYIEAAEEKAYNYKQYFLKFLNGW